MSESKDAADGILVDQVTIGELLSVLGLDSEDLEEVVQEDGTLVIPIDDRAVAIEYQEEINSVAIMGFVANASDMTLPAVLQDLLTLNAHPKETGGLFFGLIEEDVVATLLLPDVFANVQNIASAVRAVADSCARWEQVIDIAKHAILEEATAERERASFSEGPSADFV